MHRELGGFLPVSKVVAAHSSIFYNSSWDKPAAGAE
jgi:hypothetical protein